MADANPARVDIIYPPDGAVFPPEIAAPTFRWEDRHADPDAWLVAFRFFDRADYLEYRSQSATWTVPDEVWETVKERSREQEVEVAISGIREAGGQTVVSRGCVTISTSRHAVGAPVFFREVNLPFIEAVKNPAAHIRWRFGSIASKRPPPIVLEKLPVCGNCHSFSADGSLLGMDIDYANDKGSYAIAAVDREITLEKDAIITWSDYRREDGDPTFGLLSQVSPDGRYVVSTVKDRSVFVATDDLAFSQLFFPFKGILAVYDRQTGAFEALPGADDPRFVQSNANWSPDGTSIVFARSEAYDLKKLLDKSKVLLSPEECEEFLKGGRRFRYDLYRIPFNEGRGGKAEPIEGASNNGMSNYFPRFSPDGKWIVFCKADSFMLLQPDSELYIIPAEGGEARRMRCNTSRMNSWHSWSPNGKWLVFSSKMYSPYTQLFLTHVDDAGRSTPPVVLANFTEPERAANIPEFVNVAPDAIGAIAAAFLDEESYYRAAAEYVKQGDSVGAIPLCEKAIELNPKHVPSRFCLAAILTELGRMNEARAHLLEIVEHDPGFFAAHVNLGLILVEAGEMDEGEKHLAEAVRLEPEDSIANYYYAYVLHRRDKLPEAATHYSRAVASDPNSVRALLGLSAMHVTPDLVEWYDPEKAIPLAERACELTERRLPDALQMLGMAYALAGRYGDALRAADEAIGIARAAGDTRFVRQIEQDRAAYEQAAARAEAGAP